MCQQGKETRAVLYCSRRQTKRRRILNRFGRRRASIFVIVKSELNLHSARVHVLSRRIVHLNKYFATRPTHVITLSYLPLELVLGAEEAVTLALPASLEIASSMKRSPISSSTTPKTRQASTQYALPPTVVSRRWWSMPRFCRILAGIMSHDICR
jgi:hypothetical protein